MNINIELSQKFVPETHIADWFLRTHTWNIHVLRRALNDLQRFMPQQITFPIILDIGSGCGQSFDHLVARFQPQQLLALDPDPKFTDKVAAAIQRCSCPVQMLPANAAAIPLADQSVDMIFCHQSFHHIVDQESAIKEFYRVLKPGGYLLFAESTRRYIHSLMIRLLFRHPMDVQKTAEQYIYMIRETGFALPEQRISLPFLWWSRPDGGFLEWIGCKVPTQREETLINAVAIKPAH